MNRILQFDEWTEAVGGLFHEIEQAPQRFEARAAELYAQLSRWKEQMDEEQLRPWEAMLYTCLGILQWNSQPEGKGAESWLRRAVDLAPELEKAWKYMKLVLLAELASLFDDISFFPLRQVDPSERRKQKTLEVLQGIERLTGEKIKLAERWIAEGKATEKHLAAKDIVWEEASAWLAGLSELVREVEACAMAYHQSISGLYAPEEMLREFNEALERLNAYFEDWNTAMVGYRREAKQSPSALERLDALVGMKDIKKRIHDLYYFLLYLTKRRELGFKMQDEIGLHAILMGNPGTGKTTIARLLAEIYHELGLLERSSVIEVDRSQLVGSYVGHTEQKVMEAVQRAVGGVLFIDEAYSLKRAGSAENDFGQVAIDTLVAAMTGGEYAGKFAVILAGYPEEMRNFLLANPGLRSRFPESGHFYLPDFTMDELVAIGQMVARNNQFVLTESAVAALKERIEVERVDATFGNARTVKNIVLDAITAKGRKLKGKEELPADEFTILYAEDFARPLPQAKPATERLHALVGLKEIKEEIKTLFALLSIQRKRKEQGLPVTPLQFHAFFSGNPGTGKTTVAEIYASILKEAGILKRGHLVTVGRADLVAEYVGQTAVKTRRKITEALGGVLFIDEAHALIPSGSNDYSAEAIDTLVEEMTKHKENLVVVLAGYPGFIEQLLDTNPGLRSRFKKYFHFPDYSLQELLEVARTYAAEQGYQLSLEAINRLRRYFEQRSGERSGNARLARDVIEEAMQRQARRLMDTGHTAFTREELMRLEESDIRPFPFLS
ncbi:AAA family ATPase [Aneurinibacillus thermoaerophilus]|uniref:AAA+-type ATPase, SpoVK/Ycf46/Vps4 family n=1 Tax=Aneurinibacillus thermoaerophilus TaxID=143495 RepID=A0A1G7YR36_ANETH|nr:AAA family ATPase [Aneurinibacillus thermoaerophilus]MED0677103.1 AAA family ATPase [Aneurinibacillus thermoaerophilus]MED0756413.1 AAA family ATPase [Aneurinibacillus thermoaerophilus]MED0761188.1 AAA family ATPase [Aneurinibacillus thermoaerophilus]SDG99013.1 AAA+-type ATPase, SpoVK/Ycf46/Vps4 family [Aneurinibacillus thermoaerophilus]